MKTSLIVAIILLTTGIINSLIILYKLHRMEKSSALKEEMMYLQLRKKLQELHVDDSLSKACPNCKYKESDNKK